MKATVITFPAKLQSGAIEQVSRPGWLIDDTNDTLGIDLRVEGCMDEMRNNEWRITHIPTGLAVNNFPYTLASCADEAAEKAKRFYDEMVALGVDMKTTDGSAITSAVKALSKEDYLALWNRVRGNRVADSV